MHTKETQETSLQFTRDWNRVIAAQQSKLLSELSDDQVSALASLGGAVASFVEYFLHDVKPAITAREFKDGEDLPEVLYEFAIQLEHLRDHLVKSSADVSTLAKTME